LEPRTLLVEARTHGRVLLHEAAAGGAPLLVGFHGYGENAERSLADLRAIPGSEEWRLAAVQALHPFYNQKTGEVVGCWMTKQDREQAIADNTAYVRAAIDRLRPPGANRLLAVAGFSQGVAMAWRAAAGSVARCDGVIALAGDIPPELEDLSGIGEALIGCGTQDKWYAAEKLQHDLDRLKAQGVSARSCVFDGGHEWSEEFRAAAGVFLSDLARGAGVRH
jgi:predicted esterase